MGEIPHFLFPFILRTFSTPAEIPPHGPYRRLYASTDTQRRPLQPQRGAKQSAVGRKRELAAFILREGRFPQRTIDHS